VLQPRQDLIGPVDFFILDFFHVQLLIGRKCQTSRVLPATAQGKNTGRSRFGWQTAENKDR
jgi:hypothetical protein